jgi:hypothetical protein
MRPHSLTLRWLTIVDKYLKVSDKYFPVARIVNMVNEYWHIVNKYLINTYRNSSKFSTCNIIINPVGLRPLEEPANVFNGFRAAGLTVCTGVFHLVRILAK